MGPPPPMPALLTRTSMRPDRPRTALTARVTEAASSTSRAPRRIGSFSASTAAVSSVAVAGLRTPACTSWPSRAKWSAVARPMPLLLPVIRTTDMRPLYQIRRPRTASELSAPHRDDGHPDPEGHHALSERLAGRRYRRSDVLDASHTGRVELVRIMTSAHRRRPMKILPLAEVK